MGSAQAFFRRLVPTMACSAASSFFLLQPPNTGKSNDRWRGSGAAFARFSLFALPAFPGASCARLRFKADIRSMTGGAALTARGLQTCLAHQPACLTPSA